MSQVPGQRPKGSNASKNRQIAFRKILLVLSATIALPAAGYMGFLALSGEYESIVTLTTASGSQRMLSQKAMALEERMINTTDTAKVDILRKRLLMVVDQMEETHEKLVDAISRPHYLSDLAEIQALFYERPGTVDLQVRHFISSIRSFALDPEWEIGPQNVHHAHLHDALKEDKLQNSLDSVVSGYQRAGERNINMIRKYIGGVLLLITATLVVEAIWLAGPIYKQMEKENEELNRAVEERTQELARAFQEAKEEMAVRMRLEESLVESERMLGMVIAHLPVIVNVLDEKGRFILSEGRGLEALGRKAGEYVGKSIGHMYGGEDEVPEVYRKAFEGEAGHAMANQMGRIFYTRVEPLTDREGHVTGVMSVAMDITERVSAEMEAQEAQKKLVQADKMKSLGVLVAGVAHEINNPNSFIMMNVSLFERVWAHSLPHIRQCLRPDEYIIPGEMKMSTASEAGNKLLEGIRNGSERIKHIVGRLRNFALHDYESPKADVSINDIVSSAMQFTNNIIRNSTSSFSLEYGQGLPHIYVNSTEIEQVLVNLISNACHALTDSDQQILLRTSYDPEAKMVIVTIRDEGRGMPAEMIDKVTEPFFTTRRGEGGMGLGLSISNNIIKDSGGRIEIDSREGEYTEVKVLLPALLEDES